MSARSARLSVLEPARELRPLACVTTRFAPDTSGTLSITFSLMAVALLLFIGGGIDLARWLDARNKTMAAMDAAVLAAGRALQTNGGNTGEAIAVAQIYYKNAVASRIKIKSDNISFKVSDDGTAVTAIGNATIVTPFMSFGGVASLPLVNLSGDESSQAIIKIGANAKDSFEISLILDMSGSMNEGTKLADLQSAAKDLVNIVVWDHQNEYYSKVAIVPYATAVQVKSYAQQVRGTYTTGTCSTPTCQYFKFTNASGQYRTNQIGTCVTERIGVQAFSDAVLSSIFRTFNFG
jgi:Flp pilus assembly protein TadG